MARAADFNLEVANPFILGDIILDGDEDSQVTIWENGAPTTWALQFAKWRIYFNVPLPDDIEVEPEEAPEEGPGSTSYIFKLTFPRLYQSEGQEEVG